IFLGGGLALVWWQLKGMKPAEKEEFYSALSHAKYWVAIPVIIMSLLSHLSRSMRWKILLEPLGYNPKLKNVFAVTMIGYLANSAVPRLGEVLKCTFLARYENLKVDKLVGSIILERIFDLICFVIFIAITVLIQIDIVGEFFKEQLVSLKQSSGQKIWIKLVLIIFIGFVLIYITRYLFKKYPNNKIIKKIIGFISGIIQGFSAIMKLKRRKEFLAHTIFIWAMYLLQIYIGFSAMESTSGLGIHAAFSVLALATVAMIITPGGIGSFPIFVMQTLVIYNISEPHGKAFGWLLWGANTLIYIIFGLASLLLLPYLNRNKNENKPSISQPENL
ncbi:MAG: lysylphosphatidylglycerol synthase transmembrane domain-containing protein, partial [Ferruginibacter sp.]